METVAAVVANDVEELSRPKWKRPVMHQAGATTDRTQIPSSSESGRLPQGGNPTAQILNGRYDNVRVDGDAKVHTGDNVYQQSAGGDGTFFHVSGGASVLVDPLAFRNGSVHFQVKDDAEVIVGGSGSSKRTGALVRSEATHRHLIPRDTYSGTRLSFETSTLHLNRRKLEYQAGKVTGTAPYVACPNSLYPTLRSPRTKAEFAHIAQNFQLLDEHFAFYFRSVDSQG
jgi:hypothetical protein